MLVIRQIIEKDYKILEEFLYWSIFTPPGFNLPERNVICHPSIRIYIDKFGSKKGDNGVIAELDGVPVGAAWTRIIPAFGHIDYNTPELAISVLPQYRSRGIGSELMNELFQSLLKKSYKQTSLAVQKENQAVNFYLRLGYNIVKEKEEEYIMLKSLSTITNRNHNYINNNALNSLALEIPNLTHQLEYERIMDNWEHIEGNIQPELMRRYSKKKNANIPFEKWLEYCEDDRTTGSMLSTHVPCTLYFCIKDQKEIIGSIVLNHADTHRGHLHAGIVPWHRGKGYGTAMLALALKKCREKGIMKVHITPNSKENSAAIQTILNNGGILIDEFIDDGCIISRYEIDLSGTNIALSK